VGTARVRTTVGTQRPIWLPDGNRIVVRLRPEAATDAQLGEEPTAAATSTKEHKADEPTVTVYRSGEPPKTDATTQAPATPPKHQWADLGIITVGTGAVKRLLSVYTSEAWLSPNGKLLLYPIWKAVRTSGSVVSPYDFGVLDLESGQSKVVAT